MNWDIPTWLKDQILIDREKVTDGLAPLSDCLAVYHVASLTAPLSDLHGKLFKYVFTQVIAGLGKEVSEELRVDTLDSYEMKQLNDFRYKLYRRIKRR